MYGLGPGPGHRPRLNSCLSVYMAGTVNLEFICTTFPLSARGPHVPLRPRTWSLQIDPLSFIFGFIKTKYFNFVPLISTGKMSTRAPVIFTKMVTRKKPQQKETLPEEIPTGERITAKRAKKVATPRKNTASPKKRARTPAIPKSQHRGKRNCRSCRAYPVGRVRIWTTRRTARANRSAQLDRTRKCPPPSIY